MCLILDGIKVAYQPAVAHLVQSILGQSDNSITVVAVTSQVWTIRGIPNQTYQVRPLNEASTKKMLFSYLGVEVLQVPEVRKIESLVRLLCHSVIACCAEFEVICRRTDRVVS